MLNAIMTFFKACIIFMVTSLSASFAYSESLDLRIPVVDMNDFYAPTIILLIGI